jgi:hypothetical protein
MVPEGVFTSQLQGGVGLGLGPDRGGSTVWSPCGAGHWEGGFGESTALGTALGACRMEGGKSDGGMDVCAGRLGALARDV